MILGIVVIIINACLLWHTRAADVISADVSVNRFLFIIIIICIRVFCHPIHCIRSTILKLLLWPMVPHHSSSRSLKMILFSLNE